MKKTLIARALQPKNATTFPDAGHIFSECFTVVGPVISPNAGDCRIFHMKQILMNIRTLRKRMAISRHLLSQSGRVSCTADRSFSEVALAGVTGLVAFAPSLQPMHIKQQTHFTFN